jgi:hypothetical protein
MIWDGEATGIDPFLQGLGADTISPTPELFAVLASEKMIGANEDRPLKTVAPGADQYQMISVEKAEPLKNLAVVP